MIDYDDQDIVQGEATTFTSFLNCLQTAKPSSRALMRETSFSPLLGDCGASHPIPQIASQLGGARRLFQFRIPARADLPDGDGDI